MTIRPLAAVVIYCSFVTPVVPIAISWRRASDQRAAILLWLVTASLVWIVTAISAPALLAGYYSSPRFATVGLNALMMFLCAAMAFRKPNAASRLTGVAALMMAGAWLSVYAINIGA
jgi:hypothetical protein